MKQIKAIELNWTNMHRIEIGYYLIIFGALLTGNYVIEFSLFSFRLSTRLLVCFSISINGKVFFQFSLEAKQKQSTWEIIFQRVFDGICVDLHSVHPLPP